MDKQKDNAIQEQPEKERPVVAFWNKYKKEIAVAGSVVGVVGVAVLSALGIKYFGMLLRLKGGSRKLL